MLMVVWGQDKETKPADPEIKFYFSVVHPTASFSEDGTDYNFDGQYTVGFPIGINYILSDKIAFSIEFVPSITSQDSSSGVDGLLFHPGLIYRNIAGFNFLTRLAFNTNGRYGFTLVASRPILKREKVTYFLATPFPIRFGDDSPASLTVGLQFGVSF